MSRESDLISYTDWTQLKLHNLKSPYSKYSACFQSNQDKCNQF